MQIEVIWIFENNFLFPSQGFFGKTIKWGFCGFFWDVIGMEIGAVMIRTNFPILFCSKKLENFHPKSTHEFIMNI
jgi:hypothetical protein